MARTKGRRKPKAQQKRSRRTDRWSSTGPRGWIFHDPYSTQAGVVQWGHCTTIWHLCLLFWEIFQHLGRFSEQGAEFVVSISITWKGKNAHPTPVFWLPQHTRYYWLLWALHWKAVTLKQTVQHFLTTKIITHLNASLVSAQQAVWHSFPHCGMAVHRTRWLRSIVDWWILWLKVIMLWLIEALMCKRFSQRLRSHWTSPPPPPPQSLPSSRTQFTLKDVAKTQQIALASVRILLNAPLGALKLVYILDGTMPVTLAPVTDHLVRTCAFLTNFLPAFVQKE